jgi:hypothetical protein
VTGQLDEAGLFPRAQSGAPAAPLVALADTDIRLGRWQDVFLDDFRTDALIVDPPFSDRTQQGHNAGAESASQGRRRAGKPTLVNTAREGLSFSSWTADDVRDFVGFFAPRTRGWFVALTDHVLCGAWDAALRSCGRYVFSPLAFLEPGRSVRMHGDGPTQWATWIIVARPRTGPTAKWGALPGGYVMPKGLARDPLRIPGGKPLWLMRELVRHYSREGELVCDPCCGAGTLLEAARLEGRRGVGGEAQQDTFDLATARLRRR